MSKNSKLIYFINFLIAFFIVIPVFGQTRQSPPVPPVQPPNNVASTLQQNSGSIQSQSFKIAETGWKNICQIVEIEKPRVDCSIVHETFSVEEKIRMLGIEISRKDKSRSLILSTPIGVSLSEGIEISFDGQNNSKIIIAGCQATGCFGLVDLSDNLYSNFKKYKIFTVKYNDLNGSGIKIDISLNNFSLISSRSD